MENAINVSITPLQLMLGLAFQIWMIVFPIILLRKVNYLTSLVESQFSSQEEQNNQ